MRRTGGGVSPPGGSRSYATRSNKQQPGNAGPCLGRDSALEDVQAVSEDLHRDGQRKAGRDDARLLQHGCMLCLERAARILGMQSTPLA